MLLHACENLLSPLLGQMACSCLAQADGLCTTGMSVSLLVMDSLLGVRLCSCATLTPKIGSSTSAEKSDDGFVTMSQSGPIYLSPLPALLLNCDCRMISMGRTSMVWLPMAAQIMQGLQIPIIMA